VRVGHMRMATLLSWGVAPGYHEFGLRPNGTMDMAFDHMGP
jgi:hypothetical protein